MEEIVITTRESPVLKSGGTRYPFPIVRVCRAQLTFNRLASQLFTGARVAISTSDGYIIFRNSESNGAFKLSRNRNMAYISSVSLIRSMPFETGAAYRLCKVSGGGYAIKVHDPLEE